MVIKRKSSIDLIVILGATATGKTSLAVKLADAYNGEIISSDSRQVYRKLNIGTGKDYEDYNINGKIIPYHLIDILNPVENYSVYQFQIDFKTAFEKIISRRKQPILCGGTGLYIESVLLDYPLTEIPPNYKLRDDLENKSLNELRDLAGPGFTQYSNESEQNNKRRIIRFIEKLGSTGESIKQVVKIESAIVLGTDFPRDTIRRQITERLNYRLDSGLIEEVQQLVQEGLSYERLDYFGLEYKFIAQFLQKKLTKSELSEKLATAIHQFAKRQLSWFRRMERRGIKIHWIKEGDFQSALDTIKLNMKKSGQKM